MFDYTLNEDWLRTKSWDVTTPDGDPVTTLAELCFPGEVTVANVRQYIELPSWQPAPQELKAEALAFLQQHVVV